MRSMQQQAFSVRSLVASLQGQDEKRVMVVTLDSGHCKRSTENQNKQFQIWKSKTEIYTSCGTKDRTEMLVENYIIFCSTVWPFQQSMIHERKGMLLQKKIFRILISSYWTRTGATWTQTLQVVHGVVKRGKKVMTPFTLYSSSEHRNSYFRCKPLIHQNIKVDHSRFWTRSFFCRGHLSWSVRPWQNLWS